MNRENDDDEEKEGEDTDVDDYDYRGEFYKDEMNVCGKKHMLKKYVQNLSSCWFQMKNCIISDRWSSNFQQCFHFDLPLLLHSLT